MYESPVMLGAVFDRMFGCLECYETCVSSGRGAAYPPVGDRCVTDPCVIPVYTIRCSCFEHAVKELEILPTKSQFESETAMRVENEQGTARRGSRSGGVSVRSEEYSHVPRPTFSKELQPQKTSNLLRHRPILPGPPTILSCTESSSR